MKKSLYILALSVLVMSSCSDFFDEHMLDNKDPQVTDVRAGMSYVLTDDDYKQVTTYPENIAKALAVDSAALLELQAIAKEKAFTESASADLYVPALMADKFPYLDNGTTCDVQYTMREGKSFRVSEFVGAQGFELTDKDYETVWNKRGAYYLTPASLANVPAFLATRMANAKLGQIAMITYKYSEEEPESSELHDFLPYALNLSQLLEYPDADFHEITGTVQSVKSSISGRFYMADGGYSIYVYGLTDENGANVWKAKGIKVGDNITIKGRYSEDSGEPQIVDGIYVSHSTPSSTAPRHARKAAHHTTLASALYQLGEEGWTPYSNDQLKASIALPQSVYQSAGVSAITDLEIIRKYLVSAYPYAVEKEIYLVAYMGKNGATADEWVFDGTDFVLSTGYVTESMSFEVKNNQWIANISTYLQAQFVGDGPGKFTMHTVTLDGLSYIWRYQAAYGMTASSYVSGTNHRVEGWLVSPNIRLKKSIQPQLTFMQAVRYGNVNDNPKWLTVMVTDSYTGDVTTTEWKQLEWPAELPDGSNWVFQSSGIFDLSEYNGKTIVLGFRYNTNIDGVDVPSAPTWEIQHLLLAEPAEEANE